ncbi:ROK family protein [Streptacidiphilus fuscans]|uniref:ROK family protein n=1 Tax=Streptacidiphilus fuscans TaxID=2789292 RepID=A0A931B8D5_9ACTN|nr:ROK family protein [Streptacidiphilus fuscans]MBF9073105.1 ROK family protein [Streptacidiphilus fuscans]
MSTSPAPCVAAIDIGGTKIAGGLVDPDGVLLHRIERPTKAKAPDPDEVFAAVAEVVAVLAEHEPWAGVTAVGVGSAGPVDIGLGTVSPVNIPAWRGFPVVARIRELPQVDGLPTVLGGDAVAMTAAEHWRGAARGYANAICLVVSTGVGAGLVLDGRVYPGPTGNAGHLGHITVDFEGEPCPCGSRGCLERVASGTAIASWALANGWRSPGGPDGAVDAAAVAESARAGDPVAVAAFDRAARALAAGIAATATLVELDVAVLGGGVLRAGELLLAPLRHHLTTYAALPFTQGLQVRAAELGTDAGLIGAAALALDPA